MACLRPRRLVNPNPTPSPNPHPHPHPNPNPNPNPDPNPNPSPNPSQAFIDAQDELSVLEFMRKYPLAG